jgi:hypothetical protein
MPIAKAMILLTAFFAGASALWSLRITVSCALDQLPSYVPPAVAWLLFAAGLALCLQRILGVTVGASAGRRSRERPTSQLRLRLALDVVGGIAPITAATLVLQCSRCEAGDECAWTSAAGWVALVLLYGVALNRSGAKTDPKASEGRTGLDCPHCDHIAFPLSVKLKLSPVKVSPCQHCGTQLTVSAWIYGIVPVLGACGGLLLFLLDHGRPVGAATVLGSGLLAAYWICRHVPLSTA